MSDMYEHPRYLLDNDRPKCANCKWRRDLVAKGNVGETKPMVVVNGKGACGEPSVLQAYPVLFCVTDLMLCSMWEAKP